MTLALLATGRAHITLLIPLPCRAQLLPSRELLLICTFLSAAVLTFTLLPAMQLMHAKTIQPSCTIIEAGLIIHSAASLTHITAGHLLHYTQALGRQSR